jgi:hypothetical protein
MMTLKQEILAGIERGIGHAALLQLVQSCEPDPRRAYKVLQDIWLELGCDEKSEVRGQDDLEFVMEKLWYSVPAAEKVK